MVIPAAALAIAGVAFAIFQGTSSASPAAPDPNPDCSLTVPANPLTAKGLATPYQLSATDPKGGPCDEADTAQSAFVEATVLNPATGALSVYRPLVVDKGAQPAVPEVVPALPKNAMIGLWFGFNGDNLTLRSQNGSLNAGRCVNGMPGSIFGQFAFCNASEFFAAANTAINRGQIKIPAQATGKDGLPCMTTRDYGLIDQDQSDNVISSYLVRANGQVAQDNATNAAKLNDATVLVNGSDNLLLDGFVDPALGCKPWTVPDLTNPNGAQVSSLALNELFAAKNQAKPVALVPMNDPMSLDANGDDSIAKTNLYRSGVNMVPMTSTKSAPTPATYCTDTLTLGANRIVADRKLFTKAPSPDTGAANNLYTFMAQRWSASLTNLGCSDLIKVGDPIRLVTNQDGVVVNASFLDTNGHRR
ncbi:MAG TPA: hypothetical protein VH333_22160 [Pseudonocardiaceae bacterium]|nr:hypothetical protein [Pseudonocardiaceae bacterium]